MQKSQSSIADVIPAIAGLCHFWKTVQVEEDKKPLCDLLVVNVLKKFNYELSSYIYRVILQLHLFDYIFKLIN
jgi:hypothetical protein